MGGVVNSIGGFLGTSSGPQAPGGNFNNAGLNSLTAQNAGASSDQGQSQIQAAEQSGDVQSQINGIGNGSQLSTDQQQGLRNALATGATTGSDYATQQVQGNGLLMQGLNNMQSQYGNEQGMQNQQSGILNNLQSQGFNLTPGDQSLYGQESGNISRQFGQQGNQAASDLASRGLSSSGAAGAQFSGLAGSQNEQLAGAQQQIAQQRFQNTMSQIGQQQQFIGQLNNSMGSLAGQQATTAANDVNQQYGRQLSGVQQQQGALATASGQQAAANSAQNQYGLDAANFNEANKPENIGDQSIANSNTASNSFAKGLGSAGAAAM